jgi:hypothetical protein
MNSILRASALAFAVLLVACGRDEAPAAGDDARPAAADSGAQAPPVETPTATSPAAAGGGQESTASAPLAVADLDAYVAGMTREVDVLRGHADRLKQAHAAKDQAGEMAALLAMGGVEVRDAGAAAANLDVARYAHIKEQIDSVLAASQMNAAMKPQLEAAEKADLSAFTEEQRQQHATNLAQMRAAFEAPRQGLPADVAAALAAREAELAKLRAEAIALRIGGAVD